MKTKENRKGISLIVLVITIVVALILISVVITSFKNSRADLQARKVKFKTEFNILNNELYSYISDIKLKDPGNSIYINASGDELKPIMPSIEEVGFEDLVLVCNSQLVFRADAKFNEHEEEWARELAPVVNTCDDLNTSSNLGVSLTEDGGVFYIPVGEEKETIQVKVDLSNSNNKMYYAFASSNFIEPEEFNEVTSGSTISNELPGGIYYIWIKVYDENGDYIGKYISAPYTLRYVIEYDANGGTLAPENQYKDSRTAVVLSMQKPEREDYDFVGWSTDSSSSNVEYYAGEIYSIDKSIKLYAVWKTKSTSMLEIIETEGKSSIIYGKPGESITISTIPKKDGYVFNGWQFSGQGTYNTSTFTYTFGDGLGTLRAKWEEAVAVIVEDGVYYSNIYTAFFDCGTVTQKEVKLLKDVQVSVTGQILENQDIRLNLNGKTITGTTEYILLHNNGKLEVYNGNISSKGNLVKNNSELIIKSGNYSTEANGAIVNGNGSIIIDGGTISSQIGNALFQEATADNSNANIIMNGGNIHSYGSQSAIGFAGYVNFVLNDGNIENKNVGVGIWVNSSSDIKINGGSIISNTDRAIYISNSANVNITGGTIKSNSTTWSTIGNDGLSIINITGGNIISTNLIAIDSSRGTINISNASVQSKGVSIWNHHDSYITIESGTINSTDEKVIYNTSTNTAEVLGGTLSTGSTTQPTILNTGESFIIGKNDSQVSVTNPNIIGSLVGIQGDFEYYDGVISAKTSISGNVKAIPTNYKIQKVVSDGIETATLSNMYNLTRTGVTGGTVTGDSGEIAADTSCTVTATPLTGYEFVGWYDVENTKLSDSLTYTFKMPAKDYTIKAIFQEVSVE